MRVKYCCLSLWERTVYIQSGGVAPTACDKGCIALKEQIPELSLKRKHCMKAAPHTPLQTEVSICWCIVQVIWGLVATRERFQVQNAKSNCPQLVLSLLEKFSCRIWCCVMYRCHVRFEKRRTLHRQLCGLACRDCDLGKGRAGCWGC